MSQQKAEYIRESLHAAGYEFVRNSIVKGDIIVRDKETKNLELWTHNQNVAGYALLWHGNHYEFVRSLSDVDVKFESGINVGKNDNANNTKVCE